jgi:hypothetical protein
VYKPKIKEEEVQKMDIDPERTISLNIISDWDDWMFLLREVAKDRLC